MIVNARSGQLSNRLVTIAYALASAIEYRRNVWLTEFDDLKDNYECEVTWAQRVKIKASRFYAFEREVLQWFRRWFPRLRIPRIVSDWSYRNESGVERQAELIRRFFTPREEVLAGARLFYQEAFDDHATMIAVHVRRGDYDRWQGGRFSYADDVYCRNMHAVEDALIGKGHAVRFVIFSYEPVNLNNYDLRSPVFKSNCNAVQDHWLMSQCDYIMGPPSTFSLWAAYIGKRLLAFIESKDQVLKISDFVYQGLRVRY